MLLRRSSLPAFGLSLVVLLGILGTLAVGPRAIVLVLGAAAVLALVARPAWAVGLAVALPVLIEDDATWGPSAQPARFYEKLPGSPVTGLELLVLLALVAVLLDARPRGQAAPSTGALRWPLALLALSLVAGAVVGYDAGVGPTELLRGMRPVLPLLLLPALVVRVVPRHVPLRTALGAVVAMGGIKAALGLLALLTGEASDLPGVGAVTYYLAPANILMLFALLGWAAAAVRRVPMPAWTTLAAALMVASLVLSARRSFWIAVVLGLLLVVLFGIGRSSRRLGVPALVAFGVAVALSFGGGLESGLASPQDTGSEGVGARLQSLNPSALSQSKDDRYRIGERRNVLADLEAQPIAGLGIGVSYEQRYPLSLGDIDRSYVHFGALWWWMHDGILGLLGYLALLATAIWAGARVLRHHPDRLVAAAGLGGAAAFAGFATAELTATFVGPDPRSSVLVGALLGLLAVALGDAERAALSPAGAPR